MNKKIIGIFVCMLISIVVFPFSVSAGDENNPEFEDEKDDIIIFEEYYSYFLNKFFKSVDIISGWFFEESDSPDIIYISLKMGNLRLPRLFGIYAVVFVYNGTYYACGLRTHSKGDYFYELVGYIDGQGEHYKNLIGISSFDTESNIITWAVPKELIGNPQPGESIGSFYANAFLRTKDEQIIFDTPNILADRVYSTNHYTIQY